MIDKLPDPQPPQAIPATLDAYANLIWDEHCKRRGSSWPLLMSSAEFSLVLGWHEAGIPLRIVLRAFTDTKGRGGSLLFYREPVRQAHDSWLKAMA